MQNPIIIIFEYHQVPAGEHLFQHNFQGLVSEGFKTYLDEEAADTTLEAKQIATSDLVIQAQAIPEGSEGFWQREIVTTRKNTIDLLVQYQFNYHAYDLPLNEMQALLIKNIAVINSHSKGMTQGFNDLLSGKIPNHTEAYEKRIEFQNEEFAKHTLQVQDGIVCIAGIYHTNHLQSYLRSKCPDKDILSFFPYQGAPFEDFEIEARNPELNLPVFPHNARLINMDMERNRGKNIIIEDIVIYKNMVNKLEEIDRLFSKGNVPEENLHKIQNDLIALKSDCKKLKSLNNVETYLFAIDVYLLKCAMENKDLAYIRTNYNSIKKNGDSLVKTEFRKKLINIIKEIVIQYRREQKVDKEKSMKNASNPSFFVRNLGNQLEATELTPQPK